MKAYPTLLSIFLAGILLTACSSKDENYSGNSLPSENASYEESLGLYDIESSARVSDPLEGFNRAMYRVNDTLYVNAIKPLTVFYSRVVPGQVRRGVSNAYQNVGYPGRAVNSALQGKWSKLGKETQNFLVNSTLGVGGLFKASDSYGYKISPENTNQTFAAWGIGDGFYLFLPVLGPTTLRGAAGSVGDHFLDPITYIDDDKIRYSLSATERINKLSFRIDDYDSFKESSLDPYTAIKDAYMQSMKKLIAE